MELFRLTLKQAQEHIAKNPAGSKELIESLSNRVESVDQKINAYVNFDRKRVRHCEEAVGRRSNPSTEIASATLG
ncbi:MAG: hypothetical protein HY585_04995, partial [Candidatus Omnitrophica bacterium]|nr:hypothetical protein [Candidatus Omnitrophota bacterium]